MGDKAMIVLRSLPGRCGYEPIVYPVLCNDDRAVEPWDAPPMEGVDSLSYECQMVLNSPDQCLVSPA
jgi:hypothetical protein